MWRCQSIFIKKKNKVNGELTISNKTKKEKENEIQ